jgi:hypothetical protein
MAMGMRIITTLSLSLLLFSTSASALWFAAPCEQLLSPLSEFRSQLRKLTVAHPGKQLILIDLDRTAGLFDDKTNSWMMFDGFSEFLKSVRPHSLLVMYTANGRKHLDGFLKSFPEIANNFSLTAAAEEIAPLHVPLSQQYQQAVQANSLPPKTYFLDFVHQLWNKDPQAVVPGVPTGHTPPLDFQTWLHQIYFPFIAPDKAGLTKEFSAWLIDDEFAADNDRPNPSYGPLKQTGVGIYAGQRKGNTPSTGTDWPTITRLVLDKLEAK